MMTLTNKVVSLWSPVDKILSSLIPLTDLTARLYIAKVFFMSGWSKITDWETTLWLFEEEYKVPQLPPELAAYMATAGELLLPVLLVIGFLTRFATTGLFILNIVAVISYYTTLQSSPAALQDHLQWGIILAMLATAHVKYFTIDNFVERKLMSNGN
ncbi:DoxX family protein [Pseudomaricurvus albidus]|uniref:DoxX family protein n=1 Tax=Pseudomaricurvus albidus TaxID=2842452 RepID=UPI001F2112A0|nr:DoxX family protein [Aestuariicella albida]